MSKKNLKETPETIATATVFIAPKTTQEAQALIVDDAKFQSQYLKPISATGKKLRSLVHEAAMQAIMLVFASNETNFNYLNQLRNVISESLSPAQAKMVVDWVVRYSPTRFVKTKKGYSFRKNAAEDAPQFDFESANANPWYEIEMLTKDEVEELLKGVDMVTGLERIVKKYAKALEDNKVQSNDIDSVRENMERLQAIIDLNNHVIPANGQPTTETEGTATAKAA